MISLKKLFSVLLCAIALVSLASCDDSLPGAPIVVIPPGPNGAILYSQANLSDQLQIKSDLLLIDSNGNSLGSLGPGLITSKPGNTLAAWTIFRDDFSIELWQGPKAGGVGARVSPTLGNDEIVVHGSAAISPDGQKLAFGTFGIFSSVGSLYYYQPSNKFATTPINISKSFAANTVPAFSPDGKKIAFFTQLYDINGDPVSGSQGFVIADVTDESIEILKDLSSTLQPFDLDESATIDWSPNGREILFSAVGVQFRHTLGTNNAPFSLYTHGTFSPDGKRIAYVGADRQLWIENLESPDRTQLTFATDSVVYYPCWSPDSKKLIYTSIGQFDDPINASLRSIEVDFPDNRKVLATAGVARGFWLKR